LQTFCGDFEYKSGEAIKMQDDMDLFSQEKNYYGINEENEDEEDPFALSGKQMKKQKRSMLVKAEEERYDKGEDIFIEKSEGKSEEKDPIFDTKSGKKERKGSKDEDGKDLSSIFDDDKLVARSIDKESICKLDDNFTTPAKEPKLPEIVEEKAKSKEKPKEESEKKIKEEGKNDNSNNFLVWYVGTNLYQL